MDAIRAVQAAGLMTADAHGAFRPSDALTDAEALAALRTAAALLGMPVRAGE